MASTNKTANYGLNQWVKSDPVLMDDMNADNQKIDAAIKDMEENLGTVIDNKIAEVNKSITAVSEEMSQGMGAINNELGEGGTNCRIIYGSYVGTGTCGSAKPTSLTFAFKPKVVFLDEQISFSHVVTFIQGCSQAGTESSSLDVCWSDNSVSWVYDVNDDAYADRQMNAANTTYYYVALC